MFAMSHLLVSTLRRSCLVCTKMSVMIIHCKVYFVCFIFIFVVYANHKNIFITKISRSTVIHLIIIMDCEPCENSQLYLIDIILD